MTKALRLRIADPGGVIFDDSVEHIRMTSPQGGFGVLPGHCRMMISVCPGEVIYDKDGSRHRLSVNGGVVSVDKDVVTLLTR